MSRADHLMSTKLISSCRLGSVGVRTFVRRLHASGSSRNAKLIWTCFLLTATRTLSNTI